MAPAHCNFPLKLRIAQIQHPAVYLHFLLVVYERLFQALSVSEARGINSNLMLKLFSTVLAEDRAIIIEQELLLKCKLQLDDVLPRKHFFCYHGSLMMLLQHRSSFSACLEQLRGLSMQSSKSFFATFKKLANTSSGLICHDHGRRALRCFWRIKRALCEYKLVRFFLQENIFGIISTVMIRACARSS